MIIAYNTAELIAACIESIRSLEEGTKEVIVVDNASTDKGPELVARDYPWVRLIANEKNRGFSGANNQAIPLCRGRYIFFLNPDTRIESKSLKPLISFMDAHPRVALAGTKVLNPDGSIQESVSQHYPGQRHAAGELKELKGRIACVLGASMIARADLIRKIGGFDEAFFLYGEDQDLCLRIRKSGHEIGYCDLFAVTHLGGQSERNTSVKELWLKKTTAEYFFYEKHYLPGTIRRIIREDLLKTRWRFATIRLLLPFARNRERELDKLLKYRAVHETAKAIRAKLNSR